MVKQLPRTHNANVANKSKLMRSFPAIILGMVLVASNIGDVFRMNNLAPTLKPNSIGQHSTTTLLRTLREESLVGNASMQVKRDINATNATVLATTTGSVSTTQITQAPTKAPLAVVPIENNKDNREQQQHKNRTIWFLHLGKAGGETIKGVLAIGCQSRMNKRNRDNCYASLPQSALSTMTKGYTHCFQDSISREDRKLVDTFLINLRHPVDRLVSWYHYASPHTCDSMGRASINCITKRAIEGTPDSWMAHFYSCFPTVQQWASSVNNVTSQNNNNNCSIVAQQALLGQVPNHKANDPAMHVKANFRAMKRLSLGKRPNSDILAVRTEHMWSDMKALDQFLGGTGNFSGMEGTKYTHGSENIKSNVTEFKIQGNQAKHFCCGLREEMMIYHELLTRAVNLNQATKLETIQDAAERCGSPSWDAFLENCPVGDLN